MTDDLFDTRKDAIELVQRRSFQLRKSLVLLRRVLRAKRALSRLRQDVRFYRVNPAHRGHGPRVVRAVPPQGLALRGSAGLAPGRAQPTVSGSCGPPDRQPGPALWVATPR
jgi:hypothetical protein